MPNFYFECVEQKLETPTDSFGRFVFKPLEIGQGFTVGNVLRRVLLTNLRGLSITGVRIGGVNDQFSILPGVREDVLEILLNLKEIVFKGNEKEELGKLRCKIQGPAVITASSFEVIPSASLSTIEIINPHQYIATISSESSLEMELQLGWGQGYSLANNASLQNSSNFLQVDAIFMPVKKVASRVQTKFTDNVESHEQLVLDIWTDGSISPHEALCSAAKMIGGWFLFLEKRELSSLKKKQESQEKDLSNISIEELHLSTRAFNGLKKVQVHVLGDLLKYSLKDLQQIKSFGQKSVQEVVDALKKHNKTLKE
jgi:DNA-directed RNA polymerase subunit alpha